MPSWESARQCVIAGPEDAAHQATLVGVTQQAADLSKAAADSANSADEEISGRSTPTLPVSDATTEQDHSDPLITSRSSTEHPSSEQALPGHPHGTPTLPGGKETPEGIPDASTRPRPEVPQEASTTGSDPGVTEHASADRAADLGALPGDQAGTAEPEAAAHVVPSVEVGAGEGTDIPAEAAQEAAELSAADPAGGLFIPCSPAWDCGCMWQVQ